VIEPPRPVRPLTAALAGGALVLLAACGPADPGSGDDAAIRERAAIQPAAPDDGAAPVADTGSSPGAGGAAAMQGFAAADGVLTLSYPTGWTPGDDFDGRALMRGGWRANFDGSPDVPGRGLVSFSRTVDPSDGVGQAVEMLRIGASDDPGARADCATGGLDPAFGARLPDRMIGGRVWHAMQQGDAGMSQAVATTALRTLHRGTCYAVDRISYAIKARDADPTLPAQAAVAAQIDAIVASIALAD